MTEERNKNTKDEKNDFSIDYYKNMDQEEFKIFLDRLAIFHTTGCYLPPPKKTECCRKKKRVKNKPRDYIPQDKTKCSTKFGSGKIGVAHDKYGVRRCTCCNSPELNLDEILQSDLDKYNEIPSEKINLMDSFGPSTSKKSQRLNNTIINLTDSISENASLSPGIINLSDDSSFSRLSIDQNTFKDSEILVLPEETVKMELDVDEEVQKIMQTMEKYRNRYDNKTEDLVNVKKIDDPAAKIKLENIIDQEIDDYQPLDSQKDIMDYVESLKHTFEEELEKRKNLLRNFPVTTNTSEVRNEIKSNIVTNGASTSQSQQSNIMDYVEAITKHIDFEEELKQRKNLLRNFPVSTNTIEVRNEIKSNIVTNGASTSQSQQSNRNHLTKSPEVISLLDDDDVIIQSEIITICDDSLVADDTSVVVNDDNKENRNGKTGLSLECPICFQFLRNVEVMTTICGHLFCTSCIKQAIKTTKKCPICRKSLTLKGIHPIYF